VRRNTQGISDGSIQQIYPDRRMVARVLLKLHIGRYPSGLRPGGRWRSLAGLPVDRSGSGVAHGCRPPIWTIGDPRMGGCGERPRGVVCWREAVIRRGGRVYGSAATRLTNRS
jgi:hypothetical protein